MIEYLENNDGFVFEPDIVCCGSANILLYPKALREDQYGRIVCDNMELSANFFDTETPTQGKFEMMALLGLDAISMKDEHVKRSGDEAAGELFMKAVRQAQKHHRIETSATPGTGLIDAQDFAELCNNSWDGKLAFSFKIDLDDLRKISEYISLKVNGSNPEDVVITVKPDVHAHNLFDGSGHFVKGRNTITLKASDLWLGRFEMLHDAFLKHGVTAVFSEFSSDEIAHVETQKKKDGKSLPWAVAEVVPFGGDVPDIVLIATQQNQSPTVLARIKGGGREIRRGAIQYNTAFKPFVNSHIGYGADALRDAKKATTDILQSYLDETGWGVKTSADKAITDDQKSTPPSPKKRSP